MRWLLTMLPFAVCGSLQAETYIYLSTGKDLKIQIHRLNPKDGSLTAVDSIAVEGTPGSLVVDPQKRYLFATLRSTDKLASFGIDRASGKLQAINSTTLGKGENAAFVNTDRTGKYLFSASYAAGKIGVHRLEAGQIKMPTQMISTEKTAHCVMVDAKNDWVFVPHVAPNAIYQYRFDAKSGQLQAAGKVEGGALKAGPRHLAFHPTESLAFTSNEEGNSVTVYRVDPITGLHAQQTLSTLPEGFKEKNTNAEVKVHPSGKFVYVSNRGHDSIAGFRFDPGLRLLQAVGHTSTEKTPRAFDFDPTGRFLYAGGEGSGKLAVYAIDQATGQLTFIRTYDIGTSVTWVMCVNLEPSSGKE